MTTQQCDIGVIGLGTMGANLALNMASHGFTVAGFNHHQNRVDAAQKEAGELPLHATSNLSDFISMLKIPRVMMLMVPAGAAVDDMLAELQPFLKSGDIVIDGGNSHYTDTDRRMPVLQEKGIQFLGVGVSGGEEGARNGPCMMPGGPKEAYEQVRPILEACSAHIQNEPCVAYLGSGSAGHYVKMVHNGIEYGIMQLISETYDVLKRGLGYTNDDLHRLFKAWNDSPELNSFLLEITADIFMQDNGKPNQRMIDLILDEAKQKGTGGWMSEDALKIQVPIPTIDTAVMMRDLSVDKPLREQGSQMLKGPDNKGQLDRQMVEASLKNAFYAAVILTYAQGMALLAKASTTYNYDLDLLKIAKIWRGGCIIRATLLDKLADAYQNKPELPLLFLDPVLSKILSDCQADLRTVIKNSVDLGIPVPGFMASLGYYDAYRSAWLPANLIQAQRDYFGAHTYERIDQPGTFHTQWAKV